MVKAGIAHRGNKNDAIDIISGGKFGRGQRQELEWEWELEREQKLEQKLEQELGLELEQKQEELEQKLEQELGLELEREQKRELEYEREQVSVTHRLTHGNFCLGIISLLVGGVGSCGR